MSPSELGGEQVACRLGEENLAAVGRRRHPRCPMHVDADVAVGGHGRLAGVEPHSDTDHRIIGPVVRGERQLGFGCGRRGRAGPGEGNEERIALGTELVASARREDLAQDAVMVGEEAGPAIAESFGERRRAFDVREEQRDGSRRQLHFCDVSCRGALRVKIGGHRQGAHRSDSRGPLKPLSRDRSGLCLTREWRCEG